MQVAATGCVVVVVVDVVVVEVVEVDVVVVEVVVVVVDVVVVGTVVVEHAATSTPRPIRTAKSWNAAETGGRMALPLSGRRQRRELTPPGVADVTAQLLTGKHGDLMSKRWSYRRRRAPSAES